NKNDALKQHVDQEDKMVLTKSFFREILKSQNTTFEFFKDFPNRGLTIINESDLYSLVNVFKVPKWNIRRNIKIGIDKSGKIC
ncbi:MAG: hypothetical protein K2G25_04980, partial [Oscillospiraceae bacterium]|nr:hypothetical protein [Oscillospiraceae bacterium]